MDFNKELEKIGLSKERYEECLSDIVDKINGVNDLDWEDIKIKYELPMHKDCLRKANSMPFGGAFVREYFNTKGHKVSAEEAEKSFTEKTYEAKLNELRKEKQKLFDERAALRKISREDARLERDLEYLATLVKESAFQPVFPKVSEENGGNDVIVALSDVHLGLDVDNAFGTYNTEIAVKRMGYYLTEIIKISRMHKSENVYVVLLGDLVNGNIHPTVQLQNRENLVEQIQKVSELVAAFVYELTPYFHRVYVNSISGNHSRIGLKDQVLRDERLDDLPIWYMKAKLSAMNNIYFLDDNNYDKTLGAIQVRGREYLLAHGDMDRFSEAGISKLVMMIGHKPEAIFLGHLHHCSFDDVAGVKLVRSGAFCDPVDDYSISKRLTGHASQMVTVVDDKGIRAFYPVNLP